MHRTFGILALILSSLFVANVAIAKLSTVNHWALPRLPPVAEFLLLFFATGCFVAFAAYSQSIDQPASEDQPIN